MNTAFKKHLQNAGFLNVSTALTIYERRVISEVGHKFMLQNAKKP